MENHNYQFMKKVESLPFLQKARYEHPALGKIQHKHILDIQSVINDAKPQFKKTIERL